MTSSFVTIARLLLPLLVLAAAPGCDEEHLPGMDGGGPGDGAGDGPLPEGAPDLRRGPDLPPDLVPFLYPDRGVTDAGPATLQATVNPANVLAYTVSYETIQAAKTDLQVSCGAPYEVTFSGTTATRRHRVFVMGLFPRARCELTARPAGLVRGPSRLRIEVGAMPPAFPDLTVETSRPNRLEPGWTLFNLSNKYIPTPLQIVLVDPEGRIRWYYEDNSPKAASDNPARVVSEGVLFGGTYGYILPGIVSWDSKLVWREKLDMHHEIRPDPADENELWYLGHCPCMTPPRTGCVLIWDRKLRKNVYTWKTCDFIEPPKYVNDWDHLNTIEPFPGEDAWLISARNLDAIYKVSRSTGQVLWSMGPGGDFTIEPDAVFYQQHAPELQANGNILLYDNGKTGKREWSRALELSYDLKTRTVRRVWQFRPQPDIFTPIWGDADRLPGGNTLVAFGRRDEKKKSYVIEVDPQGAEVWRLALPNGWGLYRAERVARRYGWVER